MLRHHRGGLAIATMALALTGAATAIAAAREDPHAQIAFRRFLAPEVLTTSCPDPH